MNDSIENIKRSKQMVFEIVITTVVVSIGINFVVLGISNELNINNNLLLILFGCILIVISLFIVSFQKFKQSNRKQVIEAALVYDNENREIIDIDGYDFSYDVCKYLKAALSEDKNIEAMWVNDRLGINQVFNINKPIYGSVAAFDEIDSDKSHISVSRSGALLNQLLEYIVLKKLSTLTTDYFNNAKYKKEKIRKVQRDEINDFVASNVFVNLFSKPPYERVAFDNKDFASNIVYSMGKNGAIYDKFELYVPLKCKFTKEKPNTIIFKHKYFKLEIIPAFTGFGTVLPHDFENRYMQIKDFSKISCYKIMIGIDLRFSLFAFFMNKSQYYGWIDKFINELMDYASINRFFDKIRWDIVRTIIKCK